MSASKEQYRLRAFGAVKEGLSRAHDDAIEQIAMDMAWAYDCSLRVANSKKTKAIATETAAREVELIPRSAYIKEWRTKTYWEQHSNLTAAEHAWIKVQMLGFCIAPKAQASEHKHGDSIDFADISSEKKALLAIVEHNRWMAERLLLGCPMANGRTNRQCVAHFVPREICIATNLLRILNRSQRY